MPDLEHRADLLGSLLIGMTFSRYILADGQMATMSPEELTPISQRRYAPSFSSRPKRGTDYTAQTRRADFVTEVCHICHMGMSSNSVGSPAPPLTLKERAGWDIGMNTVLYFSASGAIYETPAYSKADIDQLVHEQGLQCLTSADRQFDFWFSTSTHGCQRRTNQSATELLLATTTFTAKTVPLLRGCIVVATHDADGDLDGLSWQQLELLVQRSRSLTKGDERVLSRRIVRDDRRQKRTAEGAQPASVSCARPRTPARH